MNNIVDTSIEFGGFYNSTHQADIEYRIDLDIEEKYIKDYDSINWQETHKSYIDDYCYKLSNFILHEYNVDMDFKDISLYSPNYYNYSTDKIDCKISSHQINKLNKLLLKDDDFLNFLKERTKSYDGYTSFYTFEQAKSDKDNILIMYGLEFICNKFNQYPDIEFDIVPQ